MFYWGLQVSDLLLHHSVHLFLLFGAFCWLVWLIRLGSSVPYRPFTGDTPDLAVSVLVPTYNEAIEALEANLAAILAHVGNDDEVLLLFDKRDPNLSKLTISDPRLRVHVTPPGKRAALKVGIEQANNPVFLLTGSDTRLREDTLAEILKPFNDPTVGGVTGRVLTSHRRGIGAKCYDWSLQLRNQMLYPGMSRAGTVHVLNGECYAARTELARERLDEFMNQIFMGRRFESGDDGWMTTLLLRDGYRTVYQSTAVAVTAPPETLREYARQQLRWYRNSTRRSLLAIRNRWAWRRGPLYPFHLVVALIKTPLWIGLLALSAWYLAAGGGASIASIAYLEPYWTDHRWAFFIIGIILVRALRGLPYLLVEPRAVTFLPLYAFLAPFFFAPLRFYGMLTARNASWITRDASPAPNPDFTPAIVALFLLLSGVLLLTYPGLAVALAAVAGNDADAY